MIGNHKKQPNLEQSSDKRDIAKGTDTTSLNINTCIPMQRKSILTVIPSSESVGEGAEDNIPEAHWMHIFTSKNSDELIKKNLKAIKEQMISKGAPRSL